MKTAKPKIRVVVPYPNAGEIHPRCLTSLDALRRCDEVQAEIIAVRGSSISHNRNAGIVGDRPPTVKQSGFDFDYVLSVDADIAFTPGDMLKLLAGNTDIISGAYASRSDATKYVAGHLRESGWGRPVTHLPANAFKGCVPVDWVGGGFTLIKRRVFEAMEYPYYAEGKILYKDHNGHNCAEWIGEDIGFSIAARAAGFEIYVDLDVVVEHIINPFNQRGNGMNKEVLEAKFLALRNERNQAIADKVDAETEIKKFQDKANAATVKRISIEGAMAQVQKLYAEAVPDANTPAATADEPAPAAETEAGA